MFGYVRIRKAEMKVKDYEILSWFLLWTLSYLKTKIWLLRADDINL